MHCGTPLDKYGVDRFASETCFDEDGEVQGVHDFDEEFPMGVDNEPEFPVTIEDRRAMGDDMLYPTYDHFGRWENE
jgi:hypothetical protein